MTPAEKAVTHILDRIQTDPDLAYCIGDLTESFALLCAAEAARTGEGVAAVKARRGEDLQPEHRRRDAEVETLKGRVEELEEQIEDLGDDGGLSRIRELEGEIADLEASAPDSRHCNHCGKCSDCGHAWPCVCPDPSEQPRTAIQRTLPHTATP